jgi:signal transduction histidine kinase
MRGFRRTLFLSHLGLVALALLILVVTLRGLVARYFAEQLRDRLITHAAYVRRTVGPILTDEGFAEYLPKSERRNIQRDFRLYAERFGIRIRVISLDTQVLLDTGPLPKAHEPLSPGLVSTRHEVLAALGGETNSEIRGSLLDNSSTMYLAMPVKRKGTIVGAVLATSPILNFTPVTLAFLRDFALAIGGILLMVVILSGALAQRLARPVRQLEEATRRLAAGDLSARARLRRRAMGRGDELDRLMREFNAMAERLETVDEERRAFLADVSHELRTPLTAIKGSAETLRDGAWQNPQFAPKFAGTIAEQSDRLIRLVGDLLQLARLESTVAERGIMSTHINARELCERAASAVRPIFDEKNVALEVQCPLQTLRGDADLLEQLLINLLANAARHSPPESTTTLRAIRDGDDALLQVLDEGEGIAPEHLSRLGQRFYRVQEGRERHTGGSGLGLAICQRIAIAHGGTMEIESEVGKGTVVNVRIPV